MKVRNSDGLTGFDILGIDEMGMKLLFAALERTILYDRFCERVSREVGVVPPASKQFYRNLAGQLNDALERRKSNDS